MGYPALAMNYSVLAPYKHSQDRYATVVLPAVRLPVVGIASYPVSDSYAYSANDVAVRCSHRITLSVVTFGNDEVPS